MCSDWQEDGTRSSRDATSPESMIGKISKRSPASPHYSTCSSSQLILVCFLPQAPPKFLPVFTPPESEKRQSSQRRHSIEKEAPTVVHPFVRPSRQTSKSLVSSLGRPLNYLLHPVWNSKLMSQTDKSQTAQHQTCWVTRRRKHSSNIHVERAWPLPGI